MWWEFVLAREPTIPWHVPRHFYLDLSRYPRFHNRRGPGKDFVIWKVLRSTGKVYGPQLVQYFTIGNVSEVFVLSIFAAFFCLFSPTPRLTGVRLLNLPAATLS